MAIRKLKLDPMMTRAERKKVLEEIARGEVTTTKSTSKGELFEEEPAFRDRIAAIKELNAMDKDDSGHAEIGEIHIYKIPDNGRVRPLEDE